MLGRGAADADAIKHARAVEVLDVSLNRGARVRPIATEVNSVGIEDRDESYVLSIPSDGSQATLRANTTLGLYRGLTTFGTMWYHYQGNKYILNAPVVIEDSPAFVSFVFASGKLMSES